MKTTSSLKKKTISGLFWTFSDLILNQGIQFIIQIFLARLLLPEEFGLIGMITVFIAVSNSIIDSGFSNALIREQEATQEDYSTIFYFNLVMAIILYILLYISSPIISEFFKEPMLVSILRILALTLIINSFGLIQRTMLVKKIDFRTQTTINIISSILSGILAIWLAYNGYGVWSLVIRIIFMQSIQAILLFCTNRWFPSLVFRGASFKRLFEFGWKVLVSGLIDTLYQNIYYLVIGKYFTVTKLGYYTNAQKLRDMASSSITASIQKVSFPVLSNMQGDDEKLKIGYKKIMKNAVFITFPVMIGLAVVATPFITMIFGEKWIPSITYFQLLCFAGMLFPLHAINLNILQVKGRSDLFLRLEIIKKVISVMLIIFVIVYGFGVEGLLWMAIFDSYIAYFINSYFSSEIIAYSTKEQIKDIYPILIASIAMGIITYVAGLILPQNNLIKVIVQIIIGIVSYIGISSYMNKEELSAIYEMLNSIIKKVLYKKIT